jgi:hypothetical protein
MRGMVLAANNTTCSSGAQEKIPTFMQVNMDEVVQMQIEGKMDDILTPLEPSLSQENLSSNSNRTPVLYVELQKAALFELEQMGFKIN